MKKVVVLIEETKRRNDVIPREVKLQDGDLVISAKCSFPWHEAPSGFEVDRYQTAVVEVIVLREAESFFPPGGKS
jgi:hypothetical protein